MSDEGKSAEGQAEVLSITSVASESAIYEGLGGAVDAEADEADLDVLVTVSPPEGNQRCPVDMVCVVDTSYSMSNEASMKTGDGAEARHGLSLLDVVKHAVKTIAKVLNENDRLAVVKFSDEAKVVSELTVVDKDGQKKLLGQAETLRPERRTNIWDGLKVALDTVRSRSEPTRRKPVILLLTDGRPNISPPRGEVAMLKRYRDQHNLECTISTFGFGYDLDSELLNALAIEGDGTYAFIPDASFVGTVFIHATANFLTTWASAAVLKLEPENGAKIIEVLGAPPTEVASWGHQIRLGTLHFGQERSLCVRLALPEGAEPDPKRTYCAAHLTYKTMGDDAEGDTEAEAQSVSVVLSGSLASGDNAEAKVAVARNRGLLVSMLEKAVLSNKKFDPEKNTTTVNDLTEKIKNSAAMKLAENVLTVDLLKDLEGQVTEALSKEEYFRKWGRHYLPSLRRAHQLQQCNNFKDPGVQHYGGALFKQVRDVADDVFCSLPPPKPSVRRPEPSKSRSSGFSRRFGSSNSARASPAPVASMAAYHYAGNPCFAGGRVHMADGSYKDVADVAKGDMVLTGGAEAGRVRCVVKSLTKNGMQLVVQLGDLVVTPWHPIQHNSQWRFPVDVGTPREIPCDAVYSFVLEDNTKSHSMLIEGRSCVTFGHGMTGDVVAHSYFGTGRVIEDLRKFDGWESGRVVLPYGCLVRNADSGMVVGLRV